MSNKQLQLRRGSAADHNSFTGASGEVTVNTTNKSLHVHDGATSGGVELARKDLANIAPSAAVSVNSQRITNLANPTDATDAANKQYVDGVIQGGGVSLPFIDGVSLTSGTLAGISDASILVFDGGSLVDVELGGDAVITTAGTLTIINGAVTTNKLAQGAVTAAKLEHSSIIVNGSTINLGGSLNVQGTANELDVATSGSTLTLGLPQNVTIGGTLTTTNNLVVNGNLTVSGNTVTTLGQEVLIEDNLIVLNSNLDGATAPTADAGIEVNRGSSSDARLLWDETNDRWGVQLGAATIFALRHNGVQIVTGDIADDAVTNDKLADNAVDTTQLANNSVTSPKIGNGEITNDKLADNTVTSAKLSDFTDSLNKDAGRIVAGDGGLLDSLLVGGDVSTSVVGGTLTFAIASGVIVNADVAANAHIDGSKLADNSIGTDKIQDNAITSGKIAAGAVGTEEIADEAVTSAKIADGAVTETKLANSAVTVNKLANGAVTNDKLASSQISFSNGATTTPVFLGTTLRVLGDGDVSVALTGSTFSLSLAPTLSVKAGSLSNFDTDDLTEGNNLYFTDARARGAVSVTDAGGDGTLSYDNATGVITYTGPSAEEVRAHFSAGSNITITGGTIATAATLTADLTGDVTGTVSDISNHTTDGLAEGNNLYFTDVRARAAVSVTDAGGDGTLSYDNATGVITYTGPSSAEVRAHFTAGSNITITGGTIATAANLTADLTGNVTGQVSDISNHDTDDLTEGLTNLYFTDARARAALSAGANITITGGTIATAATITADLAGNVTGQVSDISNHDTDDLTEGAGNLYYTDARVKDLITGSTIGVIDDHVRGLFSGTAGQIDLSAGGTFSLAPTITGLTSVTANTFIGSLQGTADAVASLAGFDTDDLAEGVNLYFTEQRARESFTAGANITITGGTISASASAATAGALTTAVTISLSGAVSGAVLFDGSADVDIITTIGDESITNAKLENSTVTLSDASSSVNAALGDQVWFKGTAGEVGVALSGSTFTFGLPNSVTITNVLAANTLSGNVSASSLRISGTQVTASAEEINRLYDASSNNDTTGKVAVLGTNGNLTLGGGLVTNGSVDVTGVNAYFAVNNGAGPVFLVNTNTDSVVVNTAALSVEDSLVLLNNNNLANADVGIYGKITASTYAAVAYDRSASKWKVGATPAPTAGNVLAFPATLGSLSGFAAGSVETAALTVGAIEYPSAAGTDGQVLTSDGAGGAAWETPIAAPAFQVVTSDNSTVNLSVGAERQSTVMFAHSGTTGCTVNLPSAATAGAGYEVTVKHGGEGGNITINRAGSDTIWVDFSTQSATSLNFGFDIYRKLVSDGTSKWYVI